MVAPSLIEEIPSKILINLTIKISLDNFLVTKKIKTDMATDTNQKGQAGQESGQDPQYVQHVVRVVPLGEDDPTAVSRKDKFLISTILVILLILAALAVLGFLILKPQPDVVQGQADAKEIRVSGKMPGRVAEIFVEEGQMVHKGDTLVHIISSIVDAQYEEAQAMENVAQAGQRKVDAGTRKQVIQAAYDIWQQAEAAAGIAETTYKRMEALYAKGVISQQRRDEAKAAYQASKSGAAAARSSYELAKSGAQSEDKETASAMVEVARMGKKKVDAILEDQYLTAPFDGEIISIYPAVSELIATGAPIATLQLDDRWAVFNVRETLLKDIKVGTKLKVYIPALDMDTDMTVYYIKDLGTYANWQATKATGDYDARTFQIKARPEKPIENFRPGMSVVYKGIAGQSKDKK